MYALGLRRLPDAVVEIARHIEPAFPGKAFVNQLLRTEHLVTIRETETQAGGVAIYYADGPEHAGVVREGCVRSKWGLGHVWRHRVFEVPSFYGDGIRFFRVPNPAAIRQEFFNYLESLTGQQISDDGSLY